MGRSSREKKGRRIEMQVRMPRTVPSNTQLLGPHVEDGVVVGQWCPTPDGSGPPVAVALIFNLPSHGDIVMRLKSRRAVDEMIRQLEHHAAEVFGTTEPSMEQRRSRGPAIWRVSGMLTCEECSAVTDEGYQHDPEPDEPSSRPRSLCETCALAVMFP